MGKFIYVLTDRLMHVDIYHYIHTCTCASGSKTQSYYAYTSDTMVMV